MGRGWSKVPYDAADYETRHPAVREIMRWFSYDHLQGPAYGVSMTCASLAKALVTELPDSPELTTGLRKLLEAKDCFVRASIDND